MEEDIESGIGSREAVITCISMAVLYVGILYSPTFILRFPPPDSFDTYLIRRFLCASLSSLISIIATAFLLPLMSRGLQFHSQSQVPSEKIRGWDVSDLSSVYGIRLDHMWQAALYPLLLTSLMYAGSFVIKLKLMLSSMNEERNNDHDYSSNNRDGVLQTFIDHLSSIAYDISAWRNYVVAPITEELVFRACMIPLLLCGGFETYAVMFFCPIFFSLAHLNHFLDIYSKHNRNLLRASVIVGLQLGYTVVFGSYASFLFIRTGHLIAPLLAHVFCNIMGLPVIYAPRNGFATLAFVGGVIGFVWMLFPATNPGLYSERTDSCSCWQRYCIWN